MPACFEAAEAGISARRERVKAVARGGSGGQRRLLALRLAAGERAGRAGTPLAAPPRRLPSDGARKHCLVCAGSKQPIEAIVSTAPDPALPPIAAVQQQARQQCGNWSRSARLQLRQVSLWKDRMREGYSVIREMEHAIIQGFGGPPAAGTSFQTAVGCQQWLQSRSVE